MRICTALPSWLRVVVRTLISPLFRSRLGRPYLEDFALDAQLITGPYWIGPPEFLKAGTEYAASRLEITVNQQAHCHRGGVPAACGQPMEDRAARPLLIEVERLRIELGGERLSPFFVDSDLPGAKGLSNDKV